MTTPNFIDFPSEVTSATLSGSNGIDVSVVTGTPNKIVVSPSNIPNSALQNSAIKINETVILLGSTGSISVGGGGGSGVVNTGLAGYVAYYPSNGTTVDDVSTIYTNGTNVGISTAVPTEKLHVNGNIRSSGIRFSSGGSLLSSYEIGNWNPTIYAIDPITGDEQQIQTSINNGRYTKIGNNVFIQGYIVVSSIFRAIDNGLGSAAVNILDLPFSARDGSIYGSFIVSYYKNFSSTITAPPYGYVINNTNRCILRKNATSTSTYLITTDLTDTSEIIFTAFYETL